VREQLRELQQRTGKPDKPWQDGLVTAHELREVRYAGKKYNTRDFTKGSVGQARNIYRSLDAYFTLPAGM